MIRVFSAVQEREKIRGELIDEKLKGMRKGVPVFDPPI